MYAYNNFTRTLCHILVLPALRFYTHPLPLGLAMMFFPASLTSCIDLVHVLLRDVADQMLNDLEPRLASLHLSPG